MSDDYWDNLVRERMPPSGNGSENLRIRPTSVVRGEGCVPTGGDRNLCYRGRLLRRRSGLDAGACGSAKLLSLSVLLQFGDEGIAELGRRHRLLPGDQLAVDHHVAVPVGDALDARTSLGERVHRIELDV